MVFFGGAVGVLFYSGGEVCRFRFERFLVGFWVACVGFDITFCVETVFGWYCGAGVVSLFGVFFSGVGTGSFDTAFSGEVSGGWGASRFSLVSFLRWFVLAGARRAGVGCYGCGISSIVTGRGWFAAVGGWVLFVSFELGLGALWGGGGLVAPVSMDDSACIR